MISLQLILILVFIIKIIGLVFIVGVICGIIPTIGDFLASIIKSIFFLGETVGAVIKDYRGDKKDGKNSRR